MWVLNAPLARNLFLMRLSCHAQMWYAEDRIGKDRLKGAYAWQTYVQWAAAFRSRRKKRETFEANAIARRLGGRIALGSDFPVESIDPLKGFFAAISRTNEEGDSPHGRDGWFPEQKLARDQALRGFTIDGKFIHPPIWFLSSHTDPTLIEIAAYASFQENITGSFKVGKKFDAVIWDRDIMQIEPATEVLYAKVSATIVGGRPVYGSL
jgi:predicted amidohydrolase YtcJ